MATDVRLGEALCVSREEGHVYDGCTVEDTVCIDTSHGLTSDISNRINHKSI
jgi:hypothetical protein